MKPDADLTLAGLAKLEADFLDALDLNDVTLVGNDSGAFILAAAEHPERIARLVIMSCEAFENYPPGVAGHLLCYAAKVPGGLNALFQPLRVRPFRRLPFAFGAMSNRPVPSEVMDEWLKPLLSQRAIRSDLAKYLRSCEKGEMLGACEKLRGFDRPVLVAWGADDRMMPPEHADRFGEMLPNARVVKIEDSSTLISEDQPATLARHIKEFTSDVPVGH
jgi:pimeloyl-ACP methyl ester carboxylesterase